MSSAQLKTFLKEMISQKSGIRVVLVRSAETLNTVASVTNGWTDMKLSIKGREQAHSLFKSFYEVTKSFKNVFTSDLSRSRETAQISFGFQQEIHFIPDQKLREIYFGSHEKMPLFMVEDELKHSIYDERYQPPQGEKWSEVKNRANNFLKEKITEEGIYLLFTHGGLIWTLTKDIGLNEAITNCSVVGIELSKGDNLSKQIKFVWQYPHANKIVL